MTQYSQPYDLLSADEIAVMDGLVEAWNAWVKLESLHSDETTEFRRAIHAAQHIIMARPVQRQFNLGRKESKVRKCAPELYDAMVKGGLIKSD